MLKPYTVHSYVIRLYNILINHCYCNANMCNTNISKEWLDPITCRRSYCKWHALMLPPSPHPIIDQSNESSFPYAQWGRQFILQPSFVPFDCSWHWSLKEKYSHVFLNMPVLFSWRQQLGRSLNFPFLREEVTTVSQETVNVSP